MTSVPDIAVIIAARDAAGTIGPAVASALAQPRVAEVLLVDDASRDETAAAARAAADGDPRLRIERLAVNGGPAAARNRAIDATTAPLIAILDADDRFAPDRFAALPHKGWDFWADDIAFFQDREAQARMAPPHGVPNGSGAARPPLRRLDFEAFVLGNVVRPSRARGELGFLKPVMSRQFLARHGLRYDEGLRLGEDYVLYARALAAGARFLISCAPGYGALLRADSLSAFHRTDDLAALAAADEALDTPDLTARERRALRRHLANVRARHAHRECLDIRREAGRWPALRHAAGDPARLRAVLTGVLRDKLSAAPPVPATLFGAAGPVGIAAPRLPDLMQDTTGA